MLNALGIQDRFIIIFIFIFFGCVQKSHKLLIFIYLFAYFNL